MNGSIISLILRLILGLNFVSVGIAHLDIIRFYTEDPAKISSWITPDPVAGKIIAALMIPLGLLLLIGFKTFFTLLISLALLLVNHALLLWLPVQNSVLQGPFYNTFYHTVPFMSFLLLLSFTQNNNRFSLDHYWTAAKLPFITWDELTLLTVRFFIGTLFLAQGLSIFFSSSGFIGFAKRVYVENHTTTFLPEWALWIMGISNPFILTGAAILLLIGFRIQLAAYLLSFFLVSIAFGHLLGDPFETSGDISMYGFNNLAFVLVLLLVNGAKPYLSVDLLRNKQH